MKLLMSQSEPQFMANYQYVMKNTNGCFQINKEPLEKVLKHCIISISDDQIVANPNVDDESLKKTVLVNRHISQLSSEECAGSGPDRITQMAPITDP
ncbi:hypothetical protein M9Y10_009512 [Tritrichomonas musculus]|uniref:Uncharacterized protein n=1 Tax=Tritrichomonas musculus TaxID=1915356 RepID=A0ABR2INI5_9EUKA